MISDIVKNKKVVLILLFVILFLGSVLRLYRLGAVPISPDWDEVALGYDAYSIAHTGKDEFGKLLPIVLRSFDDYKPALYTYLIIPFYKLFDLNVFAVRLPSALLGIASIFSVYLLIKRLFEREDIALLSAFMLAISPWHIQFSRVAFESNVGLAFNIFAATFFVYGLKKHWLLTLSALFAGLSIYVYQSEKVFTPLLVLGLIIIFAKPLFSIPKKYLVSAFLLGILVVLPMVFYIITDKQALLRAQGTSIFNNQTILLRSNASRNLYNIQAGNTLGTLLDNRRVIYARTILGGYLSHFNPNWLLNGDINRHHAPDMGLIYLWEFPFIAIGIYALLFGKFDKRGKLLVFFWFLVTPIPASITSEVPHAVRTLNFLPTWQVFTALGLLAAFSFIRKVNIRYKKFDFRRTFIIISISLFSLFALFNFLYFLNQYFVQQNYFYAQDWQYGYENMIEEVIRIEGSYDKVIISDKQPMDKSYMFFLFYAKYPPQKYQQFKESSGGFAQHQEFDKYEFRPIVMGESDYATKTLYVGLPSEFSDKANIIHKVLYPDGTTAMVMVGK
jgi:4-amino-4-deoxy-L-arabinose transferase-like glycosyltransferase